MDICGRILKYKIRIKVDIFQIKVYNNDKSSQLKKMRIIIYSNI
jgi:hypothetical protein